MLMTVCQGKSSGDKSQMTARQPYQDGGLVQIMAKTVVGRRPANFMAGS